MVEMLKVQVIRSETISKYWKTQQLIQMKVRSEGKKSSENNHVRCLHTTDYVYKVLLRQTHPVPSYKMHFHLFFPLRHTNWCHRKWEHFLFEFRFFTVNERIRLVFITSDLSMTIYHLNTCTLSKSLCVCVLVPIGK